MKHDPTDHGSHVYLCELFDRVANLEAEIERLDGVFDELHDRLDAIEAALAAREGGPK